MAVTGLTHTNCYKCDIYLTPLNWADSFEARGQAICKHCFNTHHNDNRMYVGGEYVNVTHPLWRAGRYRSWQDVANHQELDAVLAGDVYAIQNQAWPAWVKIGMALDAQDRLRGYQTADPHRAYRLVHSKPFRNRREAEKEAHMIAEHYSEDRHGEWFKLPPLTAKDIIEGINV